MEITHDAFNELMASYKRYVFATILNITHDNNEAEAIAQDVFLQIYLHPPKDTGNVKAYIGRIAANKAIDFNRAKRKRAGFLSLEEAKETGVEPVGSYNLEEQVLLEMESKELKQKIAKLPQIYKDVLIQFYFKQLSYREIAESEGTTVKTIESRLYRARKILYDN